MNYIIIGIVAVVAFLAYQFFNNKSDKSTSEDYSSKFNIEKELKQNDKRILVENVDYNLIRRAVQDFTKNYDNPQQSHLKPISELHKSDNNQVVITFPYDIDFEIFCYYVNYLKYPMDLNYKANVTGWTSTKSTDHWLNKDFENQKSMLFIDPNDREYDNVMLTTEDGRTYKIGFAIGEGLQNQNETILKYKPFEYKKSDLEKFESEEIK
ncbi:hypothetical protein [Aurantibacter aestuarii]|uniref:Uncharacterized protein n=1 Tax=Aurantibacter aestuarii TaxID=1266046 RepID=A0A2T1NES9_9FLAO|nr:hypothetical protein [Aurantibacter aestuarii]PSG90909.1 hypothetical protein C7H52_06450 [Aurantibacter aestuarii]